MAMRDRVMGYLEHSSRIRLFIDKMRNSWIGLGVMSGIRRVVERMRGWSRREWGILIVAVAAIGLLGMMVAGYLRGPMVSGDYSPFASKQEYDQFYKAHPLMTKKAPADASFYYKASVSSGKQAVYQVSLTAPAFHPERPNGLATYIQNLRKSQREATLWMSQQGEDVSKDYIIWDPDPDILANPQRQQPPLPSKLNGATPGTSPKAAASPTPTATGRFPQ